MSAIHVHGTRRLSICVAALCLGHAPLVEATFLEQPDQFESYTEKIGSNAIAGGSDGMLFDLGAPRAQDDHALSAIDTAWSAFGVPCCAKPVRGGKDAEAPPRPSWLIPEGGGIREPKFADLDGFIARAQTEVLVGASRFEPVGMRSTQMVGGAAAEKAAQPDPSTGKRLDGPPDVVLGDRGGAFDLMGLWMWAIALALVVAVSTIARRSIKR